MTHVISHMIVGNSTRMVVKGHAFDGDLDTGLVAEAAELEIKPGQAWPTEIVVIDQDGDHEAGVLFMHVEWDRGPDREVYGGRYQSAGGHNLLVIND